MNNFAVHALKPGMVFSQPVYIDKARMLVPAGMPILQKDLDKLAEQNIKRVLTNGSPVTGEFVEQKPKPKPEGQENGYEENEEEANSILSLSEIHEKTGAYRNYVSFIQKMNMVFLSISNDYSITGKSKIDNEISAPLLNAMRTQRNLLIRYILGGEVKGFDMAKSAVNTAILSALISWEIKLPQYQILTIINGALLHDAGMLKLPKALIEKRGGLSEAEYQHIRTHPQLSQKIVTRNLSYTDNVGYIVLQHHERWDGHGYPNHIGGEYIDIGARIVSIADAFEAMVSPRPYRNSVTGNQAMKNLLADNSRRFDPTILKAFIQIMGLYPIGSIVQLNNGIIGRVSEVFAFAPLRPSVQVLVDESKRVFGNEKGEVINLLTGKSLYITKAIDKKEFLSLYAQSS